jgi:hypothetical protein
MTKWQSAASTSTTLMLWMITACGGGSSDAASRQPSPTPPAQNNAKQYAGVMVNEAKVILPPLIALLRCPQAPKRGQCLVEGALAAGYTKHVADVLQNNESGMAGGIGKPSAQIASLVARTLNAARGVSSRFIAYNAARSLKNWHSLIAGDRAFLLLVREWADIGQRLLPPG